MLPPTSQVNSIPLTFAIDISQTTVYCAKVEQPIKWKSCLPLQVKREVPSGMTPLPCVALILLQRLVLGDLHILHS